MASRRLRNACRVFHAALCALACGSARGQSLNVDVAALTGVPGSSCAGAAAQTGFWNVLADQNAAVYTLRNLSGELLPNVLLNFHGAEVTGGNAYPSMADCDRSLMDDYLARNLN